MLFARWASTYYVPEDVLLSLKKDTTYGVAAAIGVITSLSF